jgi:hypothetical protein
VRVWPMVLIQAQLQLQSGRFGWGGGGSRMGDGRLPRAGGRPVGEKRISGSLAIGVRQARSLSATLFPSTRVATLFFLDRRGRRSHPRPRHGHACTCYG